MSEEYLERINALGESIRQQTENFTGPNEKLNEATKFLGEATSFAVLNQTILKGLYQKLGSKLIKNLSGSVKQNLGLTGEESLEPENIFDGIQSRVSNTVSNAVRQRLGLSNDAEETTDGIEMSDFSNVANDFDDTANDFDDGGLTEDVSEPFFANPLTLFQDSGTIPGMADSEITASESLMARLISGGQIPSQVGESMDQLLPMREMMRIQNEEEPEFDIGEEASNIAGNISEEAGNIADNVAGIGSDIAGNWI